LHLLFPLVSLQAAALAGDKHVVLGPHSYALFVPLVVPNRTLLVGADVASSILNFSLPGTAAPAAAISGSGDDWGMRSLTLLVTTAPAKTPAVLMRHGTANFSALGVNVTLMQTNVSNAFHIEGADFEIAHSFLWQSGVCLWPPESDQTDFPSSVTLYFHGADSGHFHHNTLLWQCAAFDMDCTSRILFEDNTITCTQAGVIPHGCVNDAVNRQRARMPCDSVNY
jgi:hypothetical protein